MDMIDNIMSKHSQPETDDPRSYRRVMEARLVGVLDLLAFHPRGDHSEEAGGESAKRCRDWIEYCDLHSAAERGVVDKLRSLSG